MEVVRRQHWDKWYDLPGDSSVIAEIMFWKENVKVMDSKIVGEYSAPQIVMYLDASHIGCGAWVAKCGELEFYQNWNSEERNKSSTWRELKGVALALAFSPSL